jgi:hypothetical protein
MDAALFEKWFSEQLIPNLPTKSVIVLDNASYHSRQLDKVPTKSSRKTDMLDYMARKGLPIPEKATRPELWEKFISSMIWLRIMEYGFATSSLLLCVIIKTHTYY